jgi:hypothetical protein
VLGTYSERAMCRSVLWVEAGEEEASGLLASVAEQVAEVRGVLSFALLSIESAA